MLLDYVIHQPAGAVFYFLSDMTAFCAVHPTITTITRIGGNQYLAYERLPLTLIPKKISYPFTLYSDKILGTLQMNALIMNLVKIDLDFKIIEETADSCRVKEEVVIHAPWLLVYFVQKIFKKQHKLLFANIAATARNHPQQ